MKAVSQHTMVSLLFMAGLVMAANQTSDCQSLLHSGMSPLSTPSRSQITVPPAIPATEAGEIDLNGSLHLLCW